jgi:HK97 gp10 family phage protein
MAGEVIEGLRELETELLQFPAKLQRKVLAKVMRAGGAIVRDLARGKVRSRSGRLAKSIRVTIVRNRKTGQLTARIIAGRRKAKNDPYYALMVEGGTEPHEIRPKGKKSLFLAGIFSELVQHPGADAKPFLGPALEEGAGRVLAALQEALAREVNAAMSSRDL